MNHIENNDDAGLADFLAAWRIGFEASFASWRPNAGFAVVTYAVIGLTNFGERPVPSTLLAEVLGRSVSQAETLAQQWGWPGTRVEDGLISVDPERARSASRRHVQIGERRFGVTGCGYDIFQYAPLVHPSLHLEETCTATGTSIRIVFTPHGVESVDPTNAVVPIPDLRGQLGSKAQVARDIEEVDANVCAQGPLYSSADAAQGWLAGNPGGRVFPIREAWDLSPLRAWRDGMMTLLNPRQLNIDT